MSTCYKTSDNKHAGCPPRMADGRHFTDYRPSCTTNMSIGSDNGVSGSNQYRHFLQNNGSTVMNLNRKHACDLNCCAPCSKEPFADTMLPEQYKVVCNENTCTSVLNDVNGLGTGRTYYTKPQSCQGLPAALPQADNNCFDPSDKFAFYGDYQPTQMGRSTHPSGGNAMAARNSK